MITITSFRIFMKRQFQGEKTFYCFSPPVMVATFIVEVVLLLYVLLKYKRSLFTYLTVAVLAVLALFQAAEYFVCAGSNPLMWSRIGSAVVTFLPVLALHLVSLVTHRTKLVPLGYVAATIFSAFLVFAPGALLEPACGGNYVIFTAPDIVKSIYQVYYGIVLLIGIVLVVRGIRQSKDEHHRATLHWLLVAYLAFVIPTMVVYLIAPRVVEGLASIMCGFAVLTALVLALRVVPAYAKGAGRHEE